MYIGTFLLYEKFTSKFCLELILFCIYKLFCLTCVQVVLWLYASTLSYGVTSFFIVGNYKRKCLTYIFRIQKHLYIRPRHVDEVIS